MIDELRGHSVPLEAPTTATDIKSAGNIFYAPIQTIVLICFLFFHVLQIVCIMDSHQQIFKTVHLINNSIHIYLYVYDLYMHIEYFAR
jgi:hypothetical protein